MANGSQGKQSLFSIHPSHNVIYSRNQARPDWTRPGQTAVVWAVVSYMHLFLPLVCQGTFYFFCFTFFFSLPFSTRAKQDTLTIKSWILATQGYTYSLFVVFCFASFSLKATPTSFSQPPTKSKVTRQPRRGMFSLRSSKLGKILRRLPAAPWDKAAPFAKSNNTFRELKVIFKLASSALPSLSSSYFALECENCFFFPSLSVIIWKQVSWMERPSLQPLFFLYLIPMNDFSILIFFSPPSLFLYHIFFNFFFYCLNFPLHFVCLEALQPKFSGQVQALEGWSLDSFSAFCLNHFFFTLLNVLLSSHWMWPLKWNKYTSLTLAALLPRLCVCVHCKRCSVILKRCRRYTHLYVAVTKTIW